jgi:gamma-glutamyltranspeptidase / glutathione hydrolase
MLIVRHRKEKPTQPRSSMKTRRTLAALFAILLAACTAAPGGGAVAQQPTITFPDGWEIPAALATPVRADGGMVATTDRIASEIGAEILRRGGNAVDAAVAVHFALAVVNPEAGNIGGGGFMVIRTENGSVASLDFRERAPYEAHRDMFLDEEGDVTRASLVGHLASGVPGSVAGMWQAHQRFGSLPWADLVEPAINLADGIVMHERLARSLRAYEARFSEFPGTERVFLPDGEVPRVGERFVQADLAATLRRVAEMGRDGFYLGETADLIVAEMERGDGIISHRDLAEYEAAWRDPVQFGYRGYNVVSMPPTSSGGPTIGAILKILEGYDLAGYGFHSPEHVHLFTEATRRGYVDRNAYLADPDFVPQPLPEMYSASYAAERRADIRMDRATPSDDVSPGLGDPPGEVYSRSESESTTHYSIVDRRGNAVGVTTTINSLYGNRVVVDGAGFFLNNEMDDFTAKPGVPNQFGLVQGEANIIEPGKRMLSAMTPTILLDEGGDVVMVTGSPGGSTIITTVAQMISNVVDFGMDLSTATAAPRLHHQHLPDILRFENAGLPEETVAALRALGHEVAERPGFQGDVQSIMVMPDGTLVGVSDPRRGGDAAGVEAPREVVH